MIQKPKFQLVSYTKNPLETIFAVWAESRPSQFKALFDWMAEQHYEVVTAEVVVHAVERGIVEAEEVEKTFQQILNMEIPITECIHFTWAFSNMPIEWREQAVRKRQWGFWLTSMREFSMKDFFSEGHYAPPRDEAIPDAALESLTDSLKMIEDGYRKLLQLGAPQEIARKLVPLCATHNGSMFSNMRTLLDTVKSRSCWIAQLDLWEIVLVSMSTELRRINPGFCGIISPPCFDRFSNEYKACKYKMINENRTCGKDPYAMCPLYYTHELGGALVRHAWLDACTARGTKEAYLRDASRLSDSWRKIWNRDAFTGELLK